MKAPKTPEYEFGGPIGATGIVFGLPILMQLLYLGCNDVSGCPAPALLEPKTLTWQKFKEQTPWPKEGIWGFMSWEVTGWLFAYYFLSLVLYRVLPAQEVYGTKLRESGKALKYRFNSFSSSVVQLVACAIGTYIYGAEFPVWTFMTTNYLQLLTTSTVLTFILSLYVYVGSFSVKKGNPELRELARGGHTGRIIYDFFIGRELNPRVTLPIFGEIDIKSWLEMRTALTGWILFNCAFIAQQYRNYGYVSDSILVIATVQAYYVLEGQYSELGLLGMMDITQDGLGFMLTWGNMVWVPFLYSTQCRYLSVYPVHLGPVGVSAIATVFAIGLYIFRSSNNQKALFRKDPNHPAFANMTFIQTKRGTKLLTGGWWGMARHINYFGDWLQSLPFSLPTKFAGYVILPAGSAVAGNEVVKMLDGRLVTPDGAAPWGMLFTYFYSAWFGFLLIHRERRDDAACIEKYGKDWDEYKSKALRFADQQRCTEEATHANELFCLLHARQAHGLYIGYKRRNAQLDALDESPPDYLAGTHIPLANDDFDSVDDSKEMEEIIDHLHVKWNTLNRVIEARRKHHAHFYSISYDYGHQAYIDKLVSHRHIVLLALGRARKRLMAILYKKEQWYSWVRDAQDDEELNREKEQKKLKQEAALFKRHMKQMEARMELMRKREDQKLQDAFLEEAYRERMAMNEDADDEAWDPIEDMEDEQRHRYIDLIKHFLWMEVEVEVDEATAEKPAPTEASSSKPADEPAPAEEAPVPTKKLKNKKKNKGKANAAANSSPLEELQNLLGQKKLLAIQASGKHSTETELKEPDKKNIETEDEMRKRLSQGVKKNLDNVSGMQLVGTIENPHETWDKTAPMEDDEIDELIRDIREIKLLLFCRLVLLQASLLPAALRATTVQEFLEDTSVTEADLRDLCLKVAEPALQDIRDACADLARGDNADDDLPVEDDDDDDDDDETMEQLLQGDKRYHHLHTGDWFKERVIKEFERRRFFRKKTKKPKRQKKTKVTICGKSIWNHASENAMSRDGWLQFSVMAKDCDLKHAIQLCRNWSEFSDLNLLTLWQYFPASNWTSWGQDRFMQQLQQLGFFPYFTDFDADKYSHHHQIGGRSQGRRQHDIVETRNILVGNMKRNDPVTRRFLQYLLMRRGELLVMVRDGKTGRVITAPDDEQLWTYRKKQGLGRASKNDWFNILEVGPDFMKLTDILREWRFGFDDYYDVFIWDFVPGEPHMELYNIVVMELHNAWRMRTPRDMYVHMEPLLRSLHRNEKTMRTRQIKPGENLKSLWDTIADERSEFRLFDVSNKKVTMRKDTELAESPYMFYNKANEVEDAILFPDELTSDRKSVAFREIRNGVASIEDAILPSTARHFVKGLEAINKGKDPMKAMRMAKHEDQDNIWGLPKVWETALLQARSDKLKKSQKALLQRTGLLHAYKTLSYDRRLEESDPMEMMERDRAFSFKESFHAGDLEPGYNAKYNLLQETLRAMLKTSHVGSTDWIFFIAEILEWLDLRGDYDDYVQDPQYPWPHSFIVQDIVQAFAMIAMFFPNSDVAKLPTMFVNSSQCDEFRKSGVFDPKERSKVRPDRRTRTSYKFREKEFWKEWKEFYKTERYFGDVYPMEWSLTVRPIIAHLYQAGVIAPAYMQNHPEVVLGMATANKEPHRPDKLDLFINYHDQYGNFPMTYPPTFVDPSKWPEVIPTARTFSQKHPAARFALLRLWSAPHYYPFMVGLFNRRNTSFLDSRGRSWEWKFVPKDMPGSEFSAHHTTGKRLDVLKDKFGDRVVHRGDLILVMGVDEDDLLRFCTAVAFAMQTKPWLREIDLWKSFINVDFEFLLDLESFWLD
ncbi:major facilitator superfamily transporter [Fusarium coicis]|nr:major facilitator superfamily transporter [Fusarium coicis]